MMIVPIVGNVTYSITMDPTVWIFDDRKIKLEDAFSADAEDHDEDDELEKAAERWNREVYQQKIKPPVNKSINRFKREDILKNTYVMPIDDFLGHAEVKPDAQSATLVTDGEDVQLSLEKLQNCFLLFARDGKPLKDNGPVHILYKDGSNRDNPITGVKKIIIN
ncbi:MAG TPA: hypothetical protein VK119_07090 [Bacillota bacterium]|nr:hypothetical protein [Bacillota bacterium]